MRRLFPVLPDIAAVTRRPLHTLARCLAACALLASTPTLASSPVDMPQLQLASAAAAVGRPGVDAPLFQKHADQVVPIASITKLMTAMVVLDSGASLSEWLEILERDTPAPANAYSRIRIGSEAQRQDLLHIALMSSENLAAHVLARHHPGGKDAFVAAMNDKARALGMHQTRFVDATGLSSDNVSTAADLLKMVLAAHEYEAIRQFSSAGRHDVRFRKPRYSLAYGNTNALVHAESWGVALSKTGYLSAAGRCLVMVADVEGEPVAMVLLDSLGTRTPRGDAGRVRRWMTTGDSGSVAAAALAYEQERTAQFGAGPQLAEGRNTPAATDRAGY
ncbi:D-alanyl-D-alanine endopeptidase [Alcanivorax sp. JB21]|uniref:D-alanyl-D-alanine endopeptidase n=1 Tax=Alcanivorax limicola TaxID=2874102 RepID=UPI001CC0AEB0|nr:D-alanyl-D-alanine endopeptidase [Alcanivorax limicola]MBZ2190004.1 D-alanyl-D-alanine endopeptidase [Alcanivorax limicola]